MSSLFAPFVASGVVPAQVQPFGVTAAQTFGANALVYATSGKVSVCGTDPAAIAGMALAPAEAGLTANKILTPDATIPVLLFTPGLVIGLSSTTTPAVATHVGNIYGVTVDAGTGFWQLNTSKVTTDARCKVIAVDIPNGIFYVQFLPANCQFGGAVS